MHTDMALCIVIKPSNIMLTRDALDEEWVRVLDFGVAKMLESVDDPMVIRLTH